MLHPLWGTGRASVGPWNAWVIRARTKKLTIGEKLRFRFTVDNSEIIVMLLPANRTEQTWWQRGIEPFANKIGSVLTTEFLPGRLRFLKAGQKSIGPNERPPFGCVLCIWNLGCGPAIELQKQLDLTGGRAE